MKHEKKIWKVRKLIKTSAYVTIGKLLKSIAFSLKKKSNYVHRKYNIFVDVLILERTILLLIHVYGR